MAISLGQKVNMKQKTQAEMESILSAYTNYQGTKKAFCQEYGIKGHTLYYWQRKLSALSPSSGKTNFIKLDLLDSVSTEGISIHYPNGNRVSLPKVVSQGLLEKLIILSV